MEPGYKKAREFTVSPEYLALEKRFIERAATVLGASVKSPEAALIALGRLAEAVEPLMEPRRLIEDYEARRSGLARFKELAGTRTKPTP